MSGRPRTTSFAEGSKSVRKTFDNQPPKPPLGGVKISSKYIQPNHSFVGHRDFFAPVTYFVTDNFKYGCKLPQISLLACILLYLLN